VKIDGSADGNTIPSRTVSRGAPRCARAEQQRFRVAHAVRRVDDDRVERTEAGSEERARVIDSEDGDGTAATP